MMLQNLTLRKSVQFAVATEKLAAEYYEKLADRFADRAEIARIFRQLAADEKDHELQFSGLLPTLPQEESDVLSDDQSMYLRAAAGSAFITGEKGALWKPDQIESPFDALTQAMAFERATLLYYQAVKEILGKNTALDAIIAAEKNHMVSLLKAIISDAEFRGLTNYWP